MGRKPSYAKITIPMYKRWADCAGAPSDTIGATLKVLQWRYYQQTGVLCKPPWFSKDNKLTACGNFTCPFCWSRNLQRAISQIAAMECLSAVVVETKAVIKELHAMHATGKSQCIKNGHLVAKAVSVNQSSDLLLKTSSLYLVTDESPSEAASELTTTTVAEANTTLDGLTLWLDTLYPPFINSATYSKAITCASDVSPWLQLRKPRLKF